MNALIKKLICSFYRRDRLHQIEYLIFSYRGSGIKKKNSTLEANITDFNSANIIKVKAAFFRSDISHFDGGNEESQRHEDEVLLFGGQRSFYPF